MSELIKKIKNDELVKGSFILIVMLVIFNILNYIFQISMANLLSPAEFGIFATLMSIVYIFSIPTETVQTITSKYISKFNKTESLGKFKDVLFRGVKKSIWLSIIAFVLFLGIGFFLSPKLRINFSLFVLTGITLFSFFTTSVQRGVLQGRKKFSLLGWSLVFESLIKVIMAILFVIIGFKIYGAMGGLVVATFSSVLIGFLMLKDVLKAKKESVDFKGIYVENLPSLIAITSIVLIYSLDIIFARAFFSPEFAGYYALVSLVGKVIFFISSSISKAMFPISSEEFESGNRTEGIFKKSALIVVLVSAFILLFYVLKNKNRKGVAIFSISWFLIALLPVSNLYPVNAYMSEHWLYIPSIGFFMILSSSLSRVYRIKRFHFFKKMLSNFISSISPDVNNFIIALLISNNTFMILLFNLDDFGLSFF